MMQFAVSLPWWGLAFLAAAAAAVAWASYYRPIAPLHPRRRAALILLRTATLLALIACLLRPVRVAPPEAADVVVPVLVDVSRSMAIADAGGRSRIEAAGEIVRRDVAPALAGRFAAETWTFGDVLRRHTEPSAPLSAGARRSDLSGALRDLRQRYRERHVAGIVVISDGGDTGAEDAARLAADGATPIFTIGVGSPRSVVDFEVLDVAAGDAALADSSVDLSVSVVSRGSVAPFDVRLLENGRPVDVRRVVPAADGRPVRTAFTVAPSNDVATVYTIEIPSTSAEPIIDNNRRSVAVEPPGRARRLLIVEGAPGFEHSFLKRALAADPGLEVDSVVRKGRDTGGDATYFVQAPSDRAPLLASGFPKDRAALYAYDAVILANVEPDSLAGGHLDALAEFVAERGGGLLVLGARSFAQQGLAGTAIEEVLPVTLSARDGVARASLRSDPFSVSLTPDGATHPVMRIAPAAAASVKRWESLPALAGASLLGSPRAGAHVLALVQTVDGQRPLVAVQRYGQGRSLVFAGEASWQWRMKMPSQDRTYELFWRQAARWVASAARDQVAIITPDLLLPGDEGTLGVEIRDPEFAPVTAADVVLRVTMPGGDTADLRPALVDPRSGRYAATMRFDEPGMYRMSVATGGAVPAGGAERWVLVGGVDREVAEPRLNEDVLRRLSHATGGAYLPASNAGALSSLLDVPPTDAGAPHVQEVWHRFWIFASLVGLLTAEWTLRRRCGMR